eukprot:TRINITY_DN73671_c0_g1_i1.p1 TRINITY_DN73671_c0_g1~~TRINITY_DN73671_c0_g1_i1.p1  ORF type:complete len:148 (-),score=28.16 TRINITY_DN73671_c0_g1_i1:51-494(-)
MGAGQKCGAVCLGLFWLQVAALAVLDLYCLYGLVQASREGVQLLWGHTGVCGMTSVSLLVFLVSTFTGFSCILRPGTAGPQSVLSAAKGIGFIIFLNYALAFIFVMQAQYADLAQAAGGIGLDAKRAPKSTGTGHFGQMGAADAGEF